jgi:hypothetical protein
LVLVDGYERRVVHVAVCGERPAWGGFVLHLVVVLYRGDPLTGGVHDGGYSDVVSGANMLCRKKMEASDGAKAYVNGGC